MARDKYHQVVKIALEKEGWTITDDPLKLELEEVRIQMDLGAERFIAAERENEKIAVEIKTFTGYSGISSFHTALGQYLNYEDILAHNEPKRILYLAIPEDSYLDFFQYRFVQRTITRFKLRIIVYNPITEVIVLWNSSN
ncbi:MAG: hypothetical protein RLZZ156_774 [Deinococcota bacterium]|jgi:hypothetical protein